MDIIINAWYKDDDLNDKIEDSLKVEIEVRRYPSLRPRAPLWLKALGNRYPSLIKSLIKKQLLNQQELY